MTKQKDDGRARSGLLQSTAKTITIGDRTIDCLVNEVSLEIPDVGEVSRSGNITLYGGYEHRCGLIGYDMMLGHSCEGCRAYDADSRLLDKAREAYFGKR